MRDQDFDQIDDEVRGHVDRIWPMIVEWNQRLAREYRPPVGSSLALDDQVEPGMWLSHIARLSLGTGSQHLMATIPRWNITGLAVWSEPRHDDAEVAWARSIAEAVSPWSLLGGGT